MESCCGSSSGNTIREVALSSSDIAPVVFAVSSNGVFWITSTGKLFFWDRRSNHRGDQNSCDSSDEDDDDSDGPLCLGEVGLIPPPTFLAVSEDNEVVVYNGAHLGMFALQRELHTNDDPFGVDNGGDLAEDILLREVFVIPCVAKAVVGLSLAQDASQVVIVTAEELILVDAGAAGDAAANDANRGMDQMSVLLRDAVMRVDCRNWFGGGDQPSGASRACFVSPSLLAVLSVHNHLVTVQVDWAQHCAWLVRDGHVVTRAHQVTALAAYHHGVVVALASGVVKLYQPETLTMYKEIDVAAWARKALQPPPDSADEARFAEKPWLRPYPAKPTRRQNPGHRVVGTKGAPRRGPQDPTYAAMHDEKDARQEGDKIDSVDFDTDILDISVGERDIVVALTVGVVCIGQDNLTIDSVNAHLFSEADTLESVRCSKDGSWAAWSPCDDYLQYSVRCLPQQGFGGGDGDGVDIIHASAPLPAKWKTELAPTGSGGSPPPHARSKTKPVLEGKGRGGPSSNFSRVQRAVEKPVTFGRPIRSSGYGADVPWSVQQERRKAAKKKADKMLRDLGMGGADGARKERIYREVPGAYDDGHQFQALSATNRILASEANVHQTAVHSSIFTATGDAMLTMSRQGGYVLKLPVTKYKGDGVFLRNAAPGGSAAPSSATSPGFTASAVNLSLGSPIVATGAADGLLQLWKPASLLTGSPSGSTGAISAGRRASGGLRAGEAPVASVRASEKTEMRSVKFFYLDRFLAYACGNRLAFCPYYLDEYRGGDDNSPLQNDLQRLRNNSKISRPVYAYTSEAQSIACMACVNHFTSSLVVIAGSNKCLTVLDAASERPVMEIPDAHSRSIHTVVMAASDASRFVSTGSLNSPHLFASAALDSSVRLWDVRQEQSVRQFALHKNAALSTIGLAFSPTGMQLAVGSEDRAVYLYDARKATEALDVIKCADAPTSVCFHPLDPVMVVGHSSGALTFYAQK